MSDAERRKFATFGYAHFPRLFSPREMARLDGAFDAAMAEVIGRARADKPVFVSMIPITVMDPLFAELLDDDRITGLADTLIGEDCLYLGISGGLLWNQPTAWHPDHGTVARQDVKIVLYLDPLEEDTGCLVVVPGSQHGDYHHALRNAFDTGLLDTARRECPGSIALASCPGDVQVFHRSLWHSTWGPPQPRRQISFNFYAGPNPAEHPTTRWDDAYVAGVAARFRTWQAGYQLYEAGFVDSAGPRRRRKIQPLIDLGFTDPRRPCVTRETVISSAPSEVRSADRPHSLRQVSTSSSHGDAAGPSPRGF